MGKRIFNELRELAMYGDESGGFYTDDFMFNMMGIEELPSALYQYTTIESLEKILSTQTLRFSRLDTVNDPEEATAADVPLASSSVFVSCWSSTSLEQIPMWSMYGDASRGVRIKMPSNMFTGRQNPTVFEKGGAFITMDSWYTLERRLPAMTSKSCSIIGPNKIYYSNDPNYRNCQMVYRENGNANLYGYDLGMVKSTHWDYEEEWRFKIAAFQFECAYPDNAYFNRVMLNLEEFPIQSDSLFIPLDSSSLSELEVTLGPRADENAAHEVEAILAKYSPEANLVRSAIRMR